MTKGNEENRTTATTNWRVTGDRPATDLWLMWRCHPNFDNCH